MYNEKKFRAIYDEFLGSGLSIRDFCANQQMNEAKFYYWQNKLKGQLPPKSGFVPVVFENGGQARSSRIPAQIQSQSVPFSNPEASTQTISCEISYPNGVHVKLNGLPDAQMLRSLLVLTRR
jgi:predicted ABC-class ATPase